MAGSSFWTTTWETIKEVDLRPLRQQALMGVRLAVVGAPGSGRHTLADQMRRDPARPQMQTDAPILICDLETASQASSADLIFLVVDSRRGASAEEKNLVQDWSNAGKKMLVLFNEFGVESTPGVKPMPGVKSTPEEPQASSAIVSTSAWERKHIVRGSALDAKFLTGRFGSAVIDLIPDRLLGLGRYYPLFRVPVAHYLINDACLSNTTYALSTGLAEVIPIFDIPLTVADMIVLTKTQAFLVYKLGLSLGYSTAWQDYVTEFGGVLGGSFLWRQLARTLIGLIPVYGIIPKVGVTYAGTYVVGNTILQWYMTGRHITKKQIQQLYAGALARGRQVAQNLLKKIPRPRLPRLPRRRQAQLPAAAQGHHCSNCGKPSAHDAAYCQYCGKAFDQPISTEDDLLGANPQDSSPTTMAHTDGVRK